MADEVGFGDAKLGSTKLNWWRWAWGGDCAEKNRNICALCCLGCSSSGPQFAHLQAHCLDSSTLPLTTLDKFHDDDTADRACQSVAIFPL
jgi:hypothetical protein